MADIDSLMNKSIHDLTDRELDRHLDRDHDRDEGERMGPSYNLRAHANLHRDKVWSEKPHDHGGTLPWGPS
jgi:hypothetical protein